MFVENYDGKEEVGGVFVVEVEEDGYIFEFWGEWWSEYEWYEIVESELIEVVYLNSVGDLEVVLVVEVKLYMLVIFWNGIFLIG